MRSEFLLQKGALQADMLFCLRAASTGSDCKICADACPDSAITFKKNGILLGESCSACTLCVGECPSSAISFFDTDIIDFLRNSAQKSFISCSGSLPCLGMLSVLDMTIIALQNDKAVTIDLSKCDECSFLRALNIKQKIEERVFGVNSFLRTIERKEVEINYKKAQKREFFRRGGEFIGRSFSDDEIKVLEPTKLKMLKALLKSEEKKDATLPFSIKIEVSDNCTICRDCSFFCPTQALKLVENGGESLLLFEASRCIDCDVCETICKSKAISKRGVRLEEFLGEDIELVRKHMLLCSVCKCGFFGRTHDNVCPRCREIEEFERSFTFRTPETL